MRGNAAFSNMVAIVNKYQQNLEMRNVKPCHSELYRQNIPFLCDNGEKEEMITRGRRENVQNLDKQKEAAVLLFLNIQTSPDC